jgi:hypothetical protein
MRPVPVVLGGFEARFKAMGVALGVAPYLTHITCARIIQV